MQVGTAVATTPGATTSNVFFTASSAGNLTSSLGQNLTINSLNFTGTGQAAATGSITIANTGGFALTLSAASACSG